MSVCSSRPVHLRACAQLENQPHVHSNALVVAVTIFACRHTRHTCMQFLDGESYGHDM